LQTSPMRTKRTVSHKRCVHAWIDDARHATTARPVSGGSPRPGAPQAIAFLVPAFGLVFNGKHTIASNGYTVAICAPLA